MLRLIELLNQFEKSLPRHDAAVRRVARQQHAAPGIAGLKPRLDTRMSRIPQWSLLSQDIHGTIAHWHVLIRFLADGTLGLHIYPVENLIRPIAQTRKSASSADDETCAEIRPRSLRRSQAASSHA